MSKMNYFENGKVYKNGYYSVQIVAVSETRKSVKYYLLDNHNVVVGGLRRANISINGNAESPQRDEFFTVMVNGRKEEFSAYLLTDGKAYSDKNNEDIIKEMISLESGVRSEEILGSFKDFSTFVNLKKHTPNHKELVEKMGWNNDEEMVYLQTIYALYSKYHFNR